MAKLLWIRVTGPDDELSFIEETKHVRLDAVISLEAEKNDEVVQLLEALHQAQRQLAEGGK